MNSMYGATGASPSRQSLRGNSAGVMKEKVPSGYKAGALNKFTPEAMDLYSQLFSNLGNNSQLQKLARGDEQTFDEMEKPAWRDYQKGLGQMGNRYAQLAPGAMSASRGSGFQNRANQYTQDFATQLQSSRQNLQSQALRDLFQMSNFLFQNQPFERTLTEKGPSKFEKGFDMFLKTADVATKFIPM